MEKITEIPTSEAVKVVEFFHQKSAGSALLGYATDNFLGIVVLHFPQLEPDLEQFSVEQLTQIKASSVRSFAWSPQTSLLVHPVGISFCTASLDCQVHLYKLNSKHEVTKSVIGEHTSFVNDVAFEPLRWELVASVGDDKKLRVWSSDVDRIANDRSVEGVFPLTARGMSVKWNISDPGKLIVAQVNGLIRMYDAAISPIQPILSLETPTANSSTGLFACDWSIANPVLIGAVIGENWNVWDVSKSMLPEASGKAHPSHAIAFRWSVTDENVFATRSRYHETSVYNAATDKVELNATSVLGAGVSWHNVLPVLAVGDQEKIIVYSMDPV